MQCSVNCRPTSLNYYISRVSSYVSHVCSYTLLAFSLYSCSKQAICSVMILIFFSVKDSMVTCIYLEQ